MALNLHQERKSRDEGRPASRYTLAYRRTRQVALDSSSRTHMNIYDVDIDIDIFPIRIKTKAGRNFLTAGAIMGLKM